MKAVVQRVTSASVSVAGEEVSRVGPGLLILLAVGNGDTEEEARWTAVKCAELRVFQDEDGKMNKSLLDVGGSALVVSQFTLYGDCSRGRRPSFTGAAVPEKARELFGAFCDFMRGTGVEVKTGVFGERMMVRMENDGPVTLIIEREKKE
ncbi:MAG: D-aminoacyl-tRNA deacylase [Candidatus Eisenbacteria bacterium]|nr:D-aminoacyl-tRNA deacylase [Candidatus Eisenbacteria bacterium]